MECRKMFLIFTVVLAVYLTVCSATPVPEEENGKAIIQESHDDPATNDERVEPEAKTKPKQKHHKKSKHHHRSRTRPHNGHSHSHRHNSKSNKKTPLSQGQGKLTNTKTKTKTQSREGRNHQTHNDGVSAHNHHVQADQAQALTSRQGTRPVYQFQQYKHNLLGQSTKTMLKSNSE